MVKKPSGKWPVTYGNYKYEEEFAHKAYEFLSAEMFRGPTALGQHLGVCDKTIRNWRRKHSEFAAAYAAGTAVSQELAFQHAKNNLISTKAHSYNAQLFNMLFYRVFKQSENTIDKLEGWSKDMTIDQQMSCVVENLQNGVISPESAEKLIKILEIKAKTTDQARALDEIQQKLDKLEKR